MRKNAIGILSLVSLVKDAWKALKIAVLVTFMLAAVDLAALVIFDMPFNAFGEYWWCFGGAFAGVMFQAAKESS